MNNKKGILLVISGPAGSGKGTVCSHLLKNEDFAYSVSATTRAPRPGEVDGKNYHFLTRDEFKLKIDNGDMLEYTEYCGNFYGTPRKYAEDVLAKGKNLILEIEVEGALNVKAQFPSAVLLLLLPPSFAIQEHRLRSRGTETEEKILARLARTKEEMEFADRYDYVVYNYDGMDKAAAEDIISIVNAEKAATKNNAKIKENYFAS